LVNFRSTVKRKKNENQLKNSLYIKMKNKYTIKSLQQLLTDNNIQHAKTSKHAQLLYQVIDAGILTREDMFPTKEPKSIDPKYEYLRSIRRHPRKVIYTDNETGETITYNSIYKASIATGCNHAFFLNRNNQDGKYTVTVE